MATVKPGRGEKARATRHRIIEAAYALFQEHGYGVTMDAIAAQAGVAMQTVYFVFHSKGQLLRAVVSYAADSRHDAPPPMQRPWIQAALRATDAREALASLIDSGTDLRARVHALEAAIDAAAVTDPELAGYRESIGTRRHEGMRQVVAHFADIGALKPGIDVDRATDILFAINNSSVYRVLVVEHGWPVDEYKKWLSGLLSRELFGD